MRLEAVIVCKDYADFLEETLPNNIQYFDHVVVVTHWTDKKTIALCNKYSVDVVQTHAFYDDGDAFNKGRAINVGLAHLKRPEKILHLDADVYLPHRFRHMLERANLQRENIYGADRVNVKGFAAWDELLPRLSPHYTQRYFVEPPAGHQIGARIIHHEHNYVPIGYFQLWDAYSMKRYPTNQGTAEHTDVLFAIQWARSQRVLLPEVIVYHLESGAGRMGANWSGRTTPEFRTHPHPPHGPPHYHP